MRRNMSNFFRDGGCFNECYCVSFWVFAFFWYRFGFCHRGGGSAYEFLLEVFFVFFMNCIVWVILFVRLKGFIFLMFWGRQRSLGNGRWVVTLHRIVGWRSRVLCQLENEMSMHPLGYMKPFIEYLCIAF